MLTCVVLITHKNLFSIVLSGQRSVITKTTLESGFLINKLCIHESVYPLVLLHNVESQEKMHKVVRAMNDENII